jgi:hypothetical protein
MQLDHLVVAARSLADGVAWCEATLGIVPGPGGDHAFMGTHNRLFGIGSAAFPRAYFEIIAIDPAAPSPARPRWFDLDNPALQRALASGPQLIHWVARCDDIRLAVAGLRSAGIDRGEVLHAGRATPRGLLRWQITLRADGQRLFGGALPTLIQWDGVHPADSLPPSGVTLAQLTVRGLPASVAPMLPAAVQAEPAGPTLSATLNTARGTVTLHAIEPETRHVQP